MCNLIVKNHVLDVCTLCMVTVPIIMYGVVFIFTILLIVLLAVLLAIDFIFTCASSLTQSIAQSIALAFTRVSTRASMYRRMRLVLYICTVSERMFISFVVSINIYSVVQFLFNFFYL